MIRNMICINIIFLEMYENRTCEEIKPHLHCCNFAGNIQTVPIGYIDSCFPVKNATPRQPTICGPSRAKLRIQQSVFNNPEHSLLGLDNYSHIW